MTNSKHVKIKINKHQKDKQNNKHPVKGDRLSPVGADNGWNDFRTTFGKLLVDFPKSVPINFYYSEIRREKQNPFRKMNDKTCFRCSDGKKLNWKK